MKYRVHQGSDDYTLNVRSGRNTFVFPKLLMLLPLHLRIIRTKGKINLTGFLKDMTFRASYLTEV